MTFSGGIRQNKYMLRWVLWVVMVSGVAIAAYPQTPTPGVVHASVPVTADPTNSYALYLPSNYSPAKRWPLLIAFDAFARGETSVNLFHEAAEKYGFIVVGSNNSRNFEDPSAAVRLLGADIKEHYSVDQRRVYLTGVSGGARVATSIAINCKSCIAGVIACVGGLPSGVATPGPEVTDWFLISATHDFNYPEMVHLKDALEENSAVSRLVIFEGEHGWMPKEYAEQALAWMQVRAMARGTAPVDKEFLGKQFDERVAEAQAAQSSGDVVAAVRDYREIVADFRTFRDVKEQEALAQSLGDSEAFRKAKKNEKAALDMQDEVATKLGNLVAGIGDMPDNREALFAQLDAAARSANRDQKQGSDAARKNATARGMASAFAFAVENGQQEMLKKDYSSAKEMFRACELIEPDSVWATYLLATAHAQLGEKKQTIQDLKRAMDKGLKSSKALDDAAFDRIRNDEAFKQIAASMATAPKKETGK
jgi:dienelactone hydrolase